MGGEGGGEEVAAAGVRGSGSGVGRRDGDIFIPGGGDGKGGDVPGLVCLVWGTPTISLCGG